VPKEPTKSAADAAPTTAVALPKQTAIAMPGSWRDRIKAVTVKVAEAEKPSGGFISFKSGRLTIGEVMMPGDKIECVVVDYLFHNKWFDTPYNSQKPTPPACYAYARDDESLQPYTGRPGGGPDGADIPGCDDPQSDFCSTCPKNEWGSAGGGSRGKACTNSRRIWLLPADVAQSVDKAQRTEYLQCDLPPTSVKNFQRFVNDAAASGMAPFQMVVELSVKPDDKTLFQVNWKPMEQIKDEAILEALARRNWLSEQQPYPNYPTKEEMSDRAQGGGSTKY
jgi:hypothetical protein